MVNPDSSERWAGLNPHCRCRKVGYMSCVPCELRFIIIMSTTRYRNSFQWPLRCPAQSGPADRCAIRSQTSDSFTWNRTNSASSAGSPPRKNSGRQPHRSNRKK